MKLTLLTLGISDRLTDQYSERKEEATKLEKPVEIDMSAELLFIATIASPRWNKYSNSNY